MSIINGIAYVFGLIMAFVAVALVVLTVYAMFPGAPEKEGLRRWSHLNRVLLVFPLMLL